MCKIFRLRPQTGNNKDSSIMAKAYRLHLDAAGNTELEMKVWTEIQVCDLSCKVCIAMSGLIMLDFNKSVIVFKCHY